MHAQFLPKFTNQNHPPLLGQNKQKEARSATVTEVPARGRNHQKERRDIPLTSGTTINVTISTVINSEQKDKYKSTLSLFKLKKHSNRLKALTRMHQFEKRIIVVALGSKV